MCQHELDAVDPAGEPMSDSGVIEVQAVRMLLLSKLFAYPSDNDLASLPALARASALSQAGGVWPALERAVQKICDDPETWAALRSEYIDFFDRAQAKTPLHGTEYGPGPTKGARLADLAGFYRAFGFAFRTDQAEMLDHVAVELEFYGLLLVKQAMLLEKEDSEGVEITAAARQEFFSTHLGPLLNALGRQTPLAEHPIYGPVWASAAAIAADESAILGVQPTSAEIVGEREPDEVQCATHPRLPVLAPIS